MTKPKISAATPAHLRSWTRAAIVGFAALAAAGCPGGAARHDGPIVLITVDAFRADLVGALGGPAGLTPHLDGLAGEAQLSTRAVSASAWTVPSMATIMTGLQPWRHGNWAGHRTVLREDLETLAEALHARGYRTSAFRSNHWLEKKFGYEQGYDEFRPLKEGKRARETLRALDGSRQFVWVHILPPHAPYVRREPFVERLGADAAGLPPRITPLDLEPYFDPAQPLPDEVRRQAWALYRVNAAWSDDLVGRLLDAVRASGQWDRALIAVTSDHGEEFGEMGQVLHGGNLGRQLVEVPLLIKLPKAFPGTLAQPAGKAIANARLFATLVEAAGGTPAPGTAPSLFAPRAIPALSELYSQNGTNQFSLVDGEHQLLWTSRFGPAEPGFYTARLVGLGGRPPAPPTEPAAAILGRLERAFAAAPPLSGPSGSRPELSLWRWQPAGAVPAAVPVLEASAGDETARLARRLRAAWKAANGAETPPSEQVAGRQPALSAEDLAELRALGYVAGGQ